MFLRFTELGALLEPGRPPKTDKSAILADAVRMVNQLRGEAQKLKDTNVNLQEKIKELKVRSIAIIFSTWGFLWVQSEIICCKNLFVSNECC